jgi:uncharacterized DUF497 family protein
MSIKMAINYNVEWDARKAHDNRDKHDVSLDEAATVSRDPNALSMLDPDHSETEDRWITMGISEKGRLLIVIHAFRQESDDALMIRLFQAGTQQNKKPKHMVNEYEKGVRFFKRGKRQVLSLRYKDEHTHLP